MVICFMVAAYNYHSLEFHDNTLSFKCECYYQQSFVSLYKPSERCRRVKDFADNAFLDLAPLDIWEAGKATVGKMY